MVVFILLAMIGVPILEIAVFIKLGGFLGLWPTLAAVIITAIIGTSLLRHQGLSALYRVQESLARGHFPMAEIFDGLCLLVAGAFLLTPGFVTDGFGLLLFLPPVRALLRRLVGHYMRASGKFEIRASGLAPDNDDTIIDGEFRDITPPDKPAGADFTDSDGSNHETKPPTQID